MTSLVEASFQRLLHHLLGACQGTQKNVSQKAPHTWWSHFETGGVTDRVRQGRRWAAGGPRQERSRATPRARWRSPPRHLCLCLRER